MHPSGSRGTLEVSLSNLLHGRSSLNLDLETLIIGGGQAGLAMSDMLSRRNRPHLILERGRIAERWRSERWDGLRFQFPNWSVRLPDYPFPHSDPDGFATSAEIVDYLDAYAIQIKAPVCCDVAVTVLRQKRLWQRLSRRNFCRPGPGQERRDRDRSLPATRHPRFGF